MIIEAKTTKFFFGGGGGITDGSLKKPMSNRVKSCILGVLEKLHC